VCGLATSPERDTFAGKRSYKEAMKETQLDKEKQVVIPLPFTALAFPSL
jgi:hypothetical protein